MTSTGSQIVCGQQTSPGRKRNGWHRSDHHWRRCRCCARRGTGRGARRRHREDRGDPADDGAVPIDRLAGQCRHPAVPAAARKRGRRQEGRGDPEGRRRRGGQRQAHRAGAGGARSGQRPVRVRADADHDGGSAARDRGQGAHDRDDGIDLGDRRPLALYRAHHPDHPADRQRGRCLGREERGQERGVDRVGLCARP